MIDVMEFGIVGVLGFEGGQWEGDLLETFSLGARSSI